MKNFVIKNIFSVILDKGLSICVNLIKRIVFFVFVVVKKCYFKIGIKVYVVEFDIRFLRYVFGRFFKSFCFLVVEMLLFVELRENVE